MNLFDTVIAYLVFSILMWAVFLWISGNIRDGYGVTQFHKATELQQNIINILEENARSIVVDKNKEWFQEELKNEYKKSFSGSTLDLATEYQDNNKYKCYNIHVENQNVFLGKEVANLDVDFNDTSFDFTNHTGEKGTEFLNFLCMYHTHSFLWDSSAISSASAPIAYALYSFFQDQQFENKIVSNKWIIYFN